MGDVSSAYASWLAFSQPKKIRLLGMVAFIMYALFLLFLVIYAFGGTGKARLTKPNIVIFMEAMPYNFALLRYYAQRTDVNVSLIVLTVNSWNVNALSAYDSTRQLITLMQSENSTLNPPIYLGNSVAMKDIAFNSKVAYTPTVVNTTACTYNRILSGDMRALADGGFGSCKVLDHIAIPESRPEFFADALEAYLKTQKANFLITGPSTDAAWFLMQYPSLRKQVRGITVSGGAFNVKGDVGNFYPSSEAAEINFFLDPEAADYIVRGTHGLPVTLLSLDSSFKWSDPSYSDVVLKYVKRGLGTTSADAVAQGLNGYMLSVSPDLDAPVELLAGMYLADPNMQNDAKVTNIPLGVLMTTNLMESGRSVRLTSGPNVKVVLAVDEKTFHETTVAIHNLKFR